MAPADIGTSKAKVKIYDNATENSSKYRWYIPAQAMSFDDPQQKAAELVGIGGVTSISDAYEVSDKYQFTDIVIDGETDWWTLKNALAYWRAQNLLLYLSYIPDGWSNNLAQYITKGNANSTNNATKTQFTGKIKNFKMVMNGARIVVSCQLFYATL